MPLSSVLGAQSLVRPGVCTSTTRPASPFEGQTVYETDTDRLATWDGSAWVAYVRQTAGKVLQVLQTTKLDSFTTASGTFTDITGLSVSITPSSTSSKVLAMAFFTATGISSASNAHIRLMRDSTEIFVGDTAGSRTRSTHISLDQSIVQQSFTSVFLDSPATTSSVSYKAQIRTNGGANAVFVNRSATDTDNSGYARTPSSITVMEISG